MEELQKLLLRLEELTLEGDKERMSEIESKIIGMYLEEKYKNRLWA